MSRKKLRNKQKVSFNPFKLLGSYLGLLLGLIGSYFSFAVILALAEWGRIRWTAVFIPIFPLVLGFFTGYGFHLLVRWLLSVLRK